MIGSSMTWFAVSIWMWQLTGRATDLALFGFFSQLPQVFMYLISGTIVDRGNRKLLMIVGDFMTGVLTIILAILYFSDHLQIWHLYLTIAIAGIFEQCQELAFEASISTLVGRQDYTRATSRGFLADSSSWIIGPALAGVLYVTIGLGGIMAIDIVTFAIAISIVLLVHIPQPHQPVVDTTQSLSIFQELGFGWQYLTRNYRIIVCDICDRALEPAMRSKNIFSSIFAPIFGHTPGAGMALLYVVCAISLRHDFVTPCF